MQSYESLRYRQCQRYEHDLFSFEIAVWHVQMHESRMSRDGWRNFDREFVVWSLQVVVAEIEYTNARVSIQGIDDVTTTLEADLAMGNVELSDGVRVDYEMCYNSSCP